MIILFWLSLLCLLYTYGGYYAIVKLLAFLKSIRQTNFEDSDNLDSSSSSSMSIIIAVYNEEDVICEKIENTLDAVSLCGEAEIIIACDGCSDRTAEFARGYSSHGVRVIELGQRNGKSAAQNSAVQLARGEILVFTDADTRIEKNSLIRLKERFRIPMVGAVVGRILFINEDGEESGVSQSEQVYWSYETSLRTAESQLGILFVVSGAFSAVRKKCFVSLDPFPDQDDSTGIDTRMQGYGVVQEPNAIAYDRPPNSISGEFSARMRMSAKASGGTLRRYSLKTWVEHPELLWSFLSRRIFRYATGYFLVVLLLSSIGLIQESPIYLAILMFQALTWIAAAIGYFGSKCGLNVKIFTILFSFYVAAVANALGIIMGAIGVVPIRWHTLDGR